jgi:hypothetical protein
MKALRLPSCNYCGHVWHPQEAVVATQQYCNECSLDRRSLAIKVFGTKPIERNKKMSAYVLPPRTKVI